MSQLLFLVEKYIFGKKVEKVVGQSLLTVILLIFKTTSDMLRTLWPFKTKELVMNNCSVIQRYRVLKIVSRIINIAAFSIYSL